MSKKQRDLDMILRNLGSKHVKVSGSVIDISDAKELGIKSFGNLDYLRSQGYIIEGMVKYKSQFKNNANESVGFKMPQELLNNAKDYMRKMTKQLN